MKETPDYIYLAVRGLVSFARLATLTSRALTAEERIGYGTICGIAECHDGIRVENILYFPFFYSAFP
ncbi:hypothetical protein PM082_002779 [Marasmius tenuissimus]|nr:hypothetical protein PM082_002779 [Marasmius tenuissimus]